MTMRRIEMKSIDPEQPAIVEIVEGRRYLLVVGAPESTTQAQRINILEAVMRHAPKSANVIVLPHGLTFTVYEDDDHPNNCKIVACPECSIRDCPAKNPRHYQDEPDGCPSCNAPDVIREHV